jgi:hypothetical protein
MGDVAVASAINPTVAGEPETAVESVSEETGYAGDVKGGPTLLYTGVASSCRHEPESQPNSHYLDSVSELSDSDICSPDDASTSSNDVLVESTGSDRSDPSTPIKKRERTQKKQN